MPRKYYKKRYSSKADKALKIAKKLQNDLQPEYKYKDHHYNGTVSDTGQIVVLNRMTRGTSSVERIGDSIKTVSIYCKGYAHCQATGATTVRRIVFIDRQPDGLVPTLGLLLQDATTDPTIAFRDLQNRDQYIILSDDHICVNPNGNEKVEFKDFYRKINLKTIFQGNTGLINDIVSNGLFVMYVSDRSTALPTIKTKHRIRYTDM